MLSHYLVLASPFFPRTMMRCSTWSYLHEWTYDTTFLLPTYVLIQLCSPTVVQCLSKVQKFFSGHWSSRIGCLISRPGHSGKEGRACWSLTGSFELVSRFGWLRYMLPAVWILMSYDISTTLCYLALDFAPVSHKMVRCFAIGSMVPVWYWFSWMLGCIQN